MGRATNYAVGSLFRNTTNIYIHGAGIISLVTLFFGFLSAGSLEGAVQIVVDFYIAKLLPWPLDTLYLAETLFDLAVSHAITIGVGLASATFSYWAAT